METFVRKSIRLPRSIAKQVEEYSQKNGMLHSDAIRKILIAGLNAIHGKTREGDAEKKKIEHRKLTVRVRSFFMLRELMHNTFGESFSEIDERVVTKSRRYIEDNLTPKTLSNALEETNS